MDERRDCVSIYKIKMEVGEAVSIVEILQGDTVTWSHPSQSLTE